MMPSESGSWSMRVIRKPDRPIVEWLALGSLGESELTFGILKDGSWVIDTADGLASLLDVRALTFAFPVLKSSPHSVQERLIEFQRNTNKTSCNAFPMTDIVLHAIGTGGYWAEQAFPWLSVIQLTDEVKQAAITRLIAIQNNKEFSQTLRHQATKQRKKLESGN